MVGRVVVTGSRKIKQEIRAVNLSGRRVEVENTIARTNMNRNSDVLALASRTNSRQRNEYQTLKHDGKY